MITAPQARRALTIPCPRCNAQPDVPCAGLGRAICHTARWHDFASRDKPEPNAACIEALTATPGQRETRSFASWLDGRHDFRATGRPGTDLTAAVFCEGLALSRVYVRRALVELAARHGLVVLAGSKGRGIYIATPRGIAFAASAKIVT